jgi:hypothetical protein
MKGNIKKIIQTVSKAIQGAVSSKPPPVASDATSSVANPLMGFTRVTEEDIRKQMGMKKGGYVKKADGCAKRGKTKGRFV